MKKIVLTIAGLLSLSLLAPTTGCGNSDDTAAAAAGSGGSSDAGAGGSGGSSDAGAGGSTAGASNGGAAGKGDAGGAGKGDAGAGDAGAAGAGEAGAGGGDSPACPPANASPLSKCDAADGSNCSKCFCADSGTDTDCKTKWEACEQDPDCNAAVACFGGCGSNPNALSICAKLAGKSLPKALALQSCTNPGKICETACK
jgi:hypothetical protein